MFYPSVGGGRETTKPNHQIELGMPPLGGFYLIFKLYFARNSNISAAVISVYSVDKHFFSSLMSQMAVG